MRKSATKLGLVAITLVATRILALLVGLVLSVRLLIIQYLNILIIIIIISFLSLRLESCYGHPRQPIILPLIHIGAWPRRSIDVVIGTGSLTHRQITCGT